MTIDHQLIEELADQYFSGRMPKDLNTYLFDRYGEEPLAGDHAPQFFYPAVWADIEKYICGELDTTLRDNLQKQQDRYEELSEIASRFAEEKRQLELENQYYTDFIRWMHLDNNYQEFRERAHEERDAFGFSHYTI